MSSPKADFTLLHFTSQCLTDATLCSDGRLAAILRRASLLAPFSHCISSLRAPSRHPREVSYSQIEAKKEAGRYPRPQGTPQPSTSQPLPRGSWILLLLPHACLTCLRRYQQRIQKPERILDTCKPILFIGVLIVLLDHPRRHPFCGGT